MEKRARAREREGDTHTPTPGGGPDARTTSQACSVRLEAIRKLERDYLFCKALSSFVKPSAVTGMDLGSEVEHWERRGR
jgi:hypothetical protein